MLNHIVQRSCSSPSDWTKVADHGHQMNGSITYIRCWRSGESQNAVEKPARVWIFTSHYTPPYKLCSYISLPDELQLFQSLELPLACKTTYIELSSLKTQRNKLQYSPKMRQPQPLINIRAMALSFSTHHRASSGAAARIRHLNLKELSPQNTTIYTTPPCTLNKSMSRFNAIPDALTRRSLLKVYRQEIGPLSSHVHPPSSHIDISTTRLHPFTVLMLRYQTLSARNNNYKPHRTESGAVQKTMNMDDNERVEGKGHGTKRKEEQAKENVGEDKEKED